MARHPRRRLFFWITILLLLVGGILSYRFLDKAEHDQQQLITTPAQRGTITSSVTATGTLSALVTVDVGSQVSGRIQELYADFNSAVEQGQVLARLDTQLFEAALQQEEANYAAARAQLAEAEAQVAEAERQAQRSTNLAQRNLIAQAEADTAQASAEVARARVQSAQASVRQARARRDQARLNLEYTTIVSPIDGVVISRDVDVGQTVAASLQAPTLFVLAEDLRRMQVDTSVAESDVGRLQAGMRALFTVDAYPEEQFEGMVRQIRNAAQTVQNVVTYNAVIDVSNDEIKLLPGMTANVTFLVATAENALLIPNSALRFRPSQALLEQWAKNRPAAQEIPQPRIATAGPSVGLDSSEPSRSRRNSANSLASGLQQTDPEDSGSSNRPDAASSHNQPGMRTIWVISNGIPQQISVRLGISDGSRSEVVGGDLRETDEVITGLANEANQDPSSTGNRRPGFRIL
ncbi:MAG: efflux RND transporter periplasmic adaptor subunit [Bradymonadales bacterium]|nr:efflux RND transporter periplasmic adaptor subunit [Bradymonadales bacterium]